MKKNYFIFSLAMMLLAGINANSQTAFENANARLNTPAFHSGCTVTVADYNNDGKDDIIRLDQGHAIYVEIQKTGGIYETRYLGDFGSASAWGMAVADVDRNGYLDILAGGSFGSVKILLSNASGTGGTIVSLPNSGFFLQNVTFGDFDNDSDIDVFCCDDNAKSHIYLNNGTATFTESTTTINFDVTSTDDSGNYGSVYTDFDNDGDLDLYIAKCRQGVTDTTDGRRINVMFVNDGNGNYTQDAASYNLNIKWQSWTASFGDIDNDGDLDLLVTNHDHESQILENDGTGHYTDITASTGFNITDITPIESVMEDFDNDGYVDLLITGSDARYYHNNGNKTFTKVTGLFDGNSMESFAIGDLNHDGFIDVYGSYATIYTNPTNINDVIWMNKTNNNNFITFNLTGTTSNVDAVGARATLYNSLGTQIREVKAGESYGTANSMMLHFGLGNTTTIDSVVIRWPSGLTQTILNPSVNQFIHVIEGECVSPDVTLTLSGPPVICTGQSLTITAPAGYNYLWNDGTTAQTLMASAAGEYGVEISSSINNCVGVSKTIALIENPDETPTISAATETEFCSGGSVQLLGPAGLTSYLWSDGSTNQNLIATQSGSYSLTIQGVCAQFSSTPIDVIVHSVSAPVAAGVYIPAPGTAQLSATGNNISWYDAAVGGTLLGTGSTFTTPFLNSTTDFYVENKQNFNGGIFPVGYNTPVGTAVYSGNTSVGTTYFDVTNPCILKEVTVHTDLAGTRRIELRDANNVLLQYQDVNILPDSQVISLNFALTPGINYSLSTNQSINQQIPGWGNVSPRLKRSSTGVTYPYTLQDAVSITGSNFGNSYYYYFYNWQVEKAGYDCFSSREPVTVTVGTVGLTELTNAGIRIFPNPAHDVLNVNMKTGSNTIIRLFDLQGRMVLNEQISNATNSLPINGLNAGVYQIEVTQGNNTFHDKLLID
jgi:hypothetical protein